MADHDAYDLAQDVFVVLYEQAFQAQLQKGVVITEKGPGDYQVISPTIQVQRSDVEKKLDQVSRDVQALREQVQKLTEELKELRTNGPLDRKK